MNIIVNGLESIPIVVSLVSPNNKIEKFPLLSILQPKV